MELQSLRCLLRPPMPEDRASIVGLFVNPDCRRFLGGPVSHVEAQRRADQILRRPDMHWMVVRKSDQQIIGLVELDLHHDEEDIEVSYEFLPAWWGQGYASEAVRSVIDYGLDHLHLHRIIAETQEDNQASRRMLERIGMQLVGHGQYRGETQCIYATPRPTRPPPTLH